MLKYYRRYKDSDEEKEITHDEALRTMLGTWQDTDLTHDMLMIQNYIECRYSFIRVDDPESELKPMPGLMNIMPDGIAYNEETWMRI